MRVVEGLLLHNWRLQASVSPGIVLLFSRFVERNLVDSQHSKEPNWVCRPVPTLYDDFGPFNSPAASADSKGNRHDVHFEPAPHRTVVLIAPAVNY